MPISEARHKANERYNAKAYDEIKVRVPKGQKEMIQHAAEASGESTNAYIIRAIEAQMNKGGGCGIPADDPSGITVCHSFSHAELEKISAACREGETAEEFVRRVVLAALDDVEQPTHNR